MTLELALELLEADRSRHLLADPDEPEDIERLERALGRKLPSELRRFLERFGGGVFYGRHEIFGARRLMLHDIEFLPDILTVRRDLGQKSGSELPPGILPFHRADGVYHVLDLRAAGSSTIRPFAAGALTSYPDLASFLRAVVLPGEAGIPRVS